MNTHNFSLSATQRSVWGRRFSSVLYFAPFIQSECTSDSNVVHAPLIAWVVLLMCCNRYCLATIIACLPACLLASSCLLSPFNASATIRIICMYECMHARINMQIYMYRCMCNTHTALLIQPAQLLIVRWPTGDFHLVKT